MRYLLRNELGQKFLRQGGLAVLAWLCSMLIVLVYGRMVPEHYSNVELQVFEEKLAKRGYLTKEELEEKSRIAARAFAEAQREVKEQDKSLWWSELRERALIISWVPWLVVGCFVIKDVRGLLLVMVILVFIALLRAQSITETLVFVTVVVAAFYLKRALLHLIARRKIAPPAL